MATLAELRKERLRKLKALRSLGIDPYPAHAERTHVLKEVVDQFPKLEHKNLKVIGRIITIRRLGKIIFIIVRDQSAQLQLLISEQNLEPVNPEQSQLGFKEMPLLDSGDFVEAEGEVIKSQTGELSVATTKLRLIGKSLRPLPLGREGFTNTEERLRRRYVDMNVNPKVRERFIRRSRFWTATRQFLNERDFAEINIPVLEHTTGGADAKPFVTHMDALGEDFYLRISHELPLKRLLGAGFEKIYDIGPRFRNENYSDEHLPEHVAMEWYWAFADWRDGMRLQTDLFRFIVKETFGTLSFKINDFEVDLSRDWEEWDYAETMSKHYDGLDIFNCSIEDVKALLRANKLVVEDDDNKARGIDKLWKHIRSQIAGPIWLVDAPTFISPLAKANPNRPQTTQRFQAVIAGSEVSNGFSELNDPIEQYNRFLEQQQLRAAGDNEAMMLDIDFIEMLEYGMPPACGLGFSERVFWLLEGVSAREGVPFPQLRMEIEATTKALYPEANL
jgi:lysyl-tRNA synthetase class 2